MLPSVVTSIVSANAAVPKAVPVSGPKVTEPKPTTGITLPPVAPPPVPEKVKTTSELVDRGVRFMRNVAHKGAPIIATVAQTYAAQPLVWLKIQRQTGHVEPLVPLAKRVGLSGIRSGVGSSAIGGIVGTGVVPILKEVIDEKVENKAVAWGLATTIPTMLQNPFKLTATWMSAKQITHQTPFQTMRTLLKEQGPVVLVTRGLGLGVAGKTIVVGSVIELREPVAKKLSTLLGGEEKNYVFISGSGMGVIATMIAYPLDTYRTQIQTGAKESIIPLIRRIGLGAYRGLPVQIGISAVGWGVFSSVYESLKKS